MLANLNWDKPLKVNGREYTNSHEAHKSLIDYEGEVQIHLNYEQHERQQTNHSEGSSDNVRIYVKQYMTKKSTPIFDFMKKWNKDKPMPMRLMEGEIIGETKGMYQMKLRGVYLENVDHCSHCGRKLTNEVSKMYGIGPVCGQHFHIAHPKSIEEFNERKEEIKQAIQSTTWSGWVIKSAIEEKVKLEKIA